jgi:hypothetical protein
MNTQTGSLVKGLPAIPETAQTKRRDFRSVFAIPAQRYNVCHEYHDWNS